MEWYKDLMKWLNNNTDVYKRNNGQCRLKSPSAVNSATDLSHNLNIKECRSCFWTSLWCLREVSGFPLGQYLVPWGSLYLGVSCKDFLLWATGFPVGGEVYGIMWLTIQMKPRIWSWRCSEPWFPSLLLWPWSLQYQGGGYVQTDRQTWYINKLIKK